MLVSRTRWKVSRAWALEQDVVQDIKPVIFTNGDMDSFKSLVKWLGILNDHKLSLILV